MIHKVKEEKDENTIKRSLSYSDAMAEESSPSKKKTRTLKSPEERTLRKNLKVKLKGLERRLLSGEFHHDVKNLKILKLDCFSDAVRPYIYELVGESAENPAAVVYAERLARDIVKKRLYYLKKKMANAVDMTEDNESQRSQNESVTAESQLMNESQVDDDENFEESEPITESQVDSYFEEEEESQAQQADKVYQCQYCEVQIASLEECYPPENRDEHNLLFECYDCHQKAAEFKCLAKNAKKQRKEIKKRLLDKKKELLDASTPEQGKGKAKTKTKPKGPAKAKTKTKPKGRAKAKTKPKPKGRAKAKTKPKGPDVDEQVTRRSYDVDEHGNRTKTKPAGPICKFSVDQNVLAKWPEDGKHYPAQVFSASKKVYDVYFPQDSEILLGVKEKDLSLPKKKSLWKNIKRKSFLTMGSFDHKSMAKGTPRNYGKFQPVKMGEKKKVNKYLCREIMSNTRRNDGKQRHYYFDMGYVQQILLQEAYPLHTLEQIYE